MPDFMKNKAAQIALIFLIGSSYSLLLTVNKIAVTHGVPSSAYVFWHCLGAGLIMGILALIRGERFPLGRQYIFTYVVWGLLSVAAPITLLTWIAPNLPAGIITLTMVLVPLVVIVPILVWPLPAPVLRLVLVLLLVMVGVPTVLSQ